jgi:uncharacterized membrane protein YfcA
LERGTNLTKKYLKIIFIGIITGLANGLFGSGGGMIVVPAMIALLGIEEHKAHATAIFIILPLSLVSMYLYISNNYINWEITWKVMLGGVAGGYIGAKLLNLLPTHILRRVFAIFIIAAAIKMLI